MNSALVALRVDVENLAALLHILVRGAEVDADLRRTLQLAARAAEGSPRVSNSSPEPRRHHE